MGALNAQAAAPVIAYTDIESGPNTGGENNNGAYLSIFGKNFGSDINAISVTIGGGPIARKMFLGPSYGRKDIQWLAVQLGPAAATGAIKVTLAGVDSNTDKIFTVRPGRFFYVSLIGSDSTGLVNDNFHPYRTINGLKTILTPGDFVIIRGGNYILSDPANGSSNNDWMRYVPGGTPTGPIAYVGYPGETVFANLNNGQGIFMFSQSTGAVFANITASRTDCIGGVPMMAGAIAGTSACAQPYGSQNDNHSSYVRIVNMEVTGQDLGGECAGSGDEMLDIGFADHTKVFGVSVHNTGYNATGAEHVFYLSATQQNTEIGWCDIHNIPTSRGVIQAHQDNFSGACYTWKAITDIYIHDTVIHDTYGQAIILAGSVGDVYLYNNLLYNTPTNNPTSNGYGDVISLRSENDAFPGNPGLLNLRMYNNTIYGNPRAGTGFLLGICWPNCPTGLTMLNNIFSTAQPGEQYYGTDGSYATLNAWAPTTAMVSDNNIWYGSSSPMPSFGGSGTHELNTNPQFLNPGAGNFHVASASDAAAKKGSNTVSSLVQWDFDLNPRTISSGYDIGAYQFQGPLNLAAPAAPRGFTLK